MTEILSSILCIFLVWISSKVPVHKSARSRSSPCLLFSGWFRLWAFPQSWIDYSLGLPAEFLTLQGLQSYLLFFDKSPQLYLLFDCGCLSLLLG